MNPRDDTKINGFDFFLAPMMEMAADAIRARMRPSEIMRAIILSGDGPPGALFSISRSGDQSDRDHEHRDDRQDEDGTEKSRVVLECSFRGGCVLDGGRKDGRHDDHRDGCGNYAGHDFRHHSHCFTSYFLVKLFTATMINPRIENITVTPTRLAHLSPFPPRDVRSAITSVAIGARSEPIIMIPIATATTVMTVELIDRAISVNSNSEYITIPKRKNRNILTY